jgi:NitT/TauT family transport system substrate-binding protein
MKRGWFVAIALLALVGAGAWWFLTSGSTPSNTLQVAISPYQDIGMVVNLKPMGLEKKYGVNVELKTLAWEDIVPAMASAGSTVDLGYASLIGYLTKQQNLNNGGDDDVIFIYPAYVFKGGGFISFKSDIGVIDREGLQNPATMKAFFSHRIGAEKNSLFDMMLFRVAKQAGIDPQTLHIVDSGLDNSLLAARNGDLDIASAGLTQLTEARRTGGRLVLSMDTANFADITGFITTKRKLAEKRPQIEAFIRMWFETVAYVLADPVKNSAYTRAYLDQHGATHYSPQEYAAAVSNEFFPRSIPEMQATLLSKNGRFSMAGITDSASSFLVANKIVTRAPLPPQPIDLKP